jgi:hypothetical protein
VSDEGLFLGYEYTTNMPQSRLWKLWEIHEHYLNSRQQHHHRQESTNMS